MCIFRRIVVDKYLRNSWSEVRKLKSVKNKIQYTIDTIYIYIYIYSHGQKKVTPPKIVIFFE